MSHQYRIPADLDRPDVIFTIPFLGIPLTARQILGIVLPLAVVGGIVAWQAYVFLGYLWAIAAAFLFAIPAIGLPGIRPEGLPPEEAVKAMLVHHAGPKHFVWAPHGLVKRPRMRHKIVRVSKDAQPRISPLPKLWGRLKGSDIEIGRDSYARVFVLSTVNLDLASEAEQQSKVDGFATLLNGADDTLQFLIRGELIDTEAMAMKAEMAAVNPALSAAATQYASHLREMQGGYRRVVYVVLRGSKEQLDNREELLLSLLQPLGSTARRLSGTEVGRVLAEAAGTEAMAWQ
jgi:hypothetical protein